MSCPCCGYCSHCGRSNRPYPWNGYQWYGNGVSYSVPAGIGQTDNTVDFGKLQEFAAQCDHTLDKNGNKK